MLRDEAGAGLHHLGQAQAIGHNRDPGPDRVPVARARAHESHGQGSVLVSEVVAKDAQLRRRARGHHHEVRVAVALEVEDRKGAAVLVEVEARAARDVHEPAVTVVAQENVPLVLGLGPRSRRAGD